MVFPLRPLVVFAIAIGVSLSFGSSVVADEQQDDGFQPEAKAAPDAQQPAVEEPMLKAQAPARKGSSLADAAARIRLTQPASDGSLVISNATLQKSGAKGAISVGGGVAAGSGGQAAGAVAGTGGSGAANTMAQQYNEQLRTVESLEVRLKNFDDQLEQPARDPHYPYLTSRPHDRAPGVQDPASAQRDALAQQLEAERKKLDALRDGARRQGVRLD